MSMRTEILIEFPYLTNSMNLLGLSEYDENSGEDIEEYFVNNIKQLFDSYPSVSQALKLFFDDVFNKTEKISHPLFQRGNIAEKSNIALYKLSILFPYCFHNQILINGVANLWAKECFDHIRKLDRKYDRELMLICADLGIRIENISMSERASIEKPSMSSSMLMEYRMNYADYLLHSVSLNDPYYKLTNKYLMKGKVYLIKDEISHLAREAVRKRVLNANLEISEDLLEKLKAIPQFYDIYCDIETKLNSMKKTHFEEGNFVGEVTSDLFPPCINVILSKASQGINLSHYERLSIAFFYLNTNHSVEETIDVFRTLPDFNESICRYQVEFANGQGPSGKKYAMFGCDKMKSYSLCYANDANFGDPICSQGVKKRNSPNYEPIKNPLDFIFWKKVVLNRTQRRKERANQRNQSTRGDQESQANQSTRGDQESQANQSTWRNQESQANQSTRGKQAFQGNKNIQNLKKNREEDNP
jgi:DNA primase large subunit